MRQTRDRIQLSRTLLVLLATGIAPIDSSAEAVAQEADTADESSWARLSPALVTSLAAAGEDDRIPVLVEYTATEPLPVGLQGPDAVAALRRRSDAVVGGLASIVTGDPEIAVTERHWIVPAVSAEATPAGIRRLAGLAGVARIWSDGPIPVVLPPEGSVFAVPAYTSQAMRTIGADAVWEQGVTGAGTTVAIFDSGVDGDNAMLSSRWRGRRTGTRAAWFDPFRGATSPQDFNGHGTQVAVAAVGALSAGDTLVLADGGFLVATSDIDVVTGPAPGAEWIAARVFDDLAGGVYTRRSVLIQAFQWALDPDGNPASDDAPDVINNSWGIAPQTGDLDACEDVIYDAVDAVESAGIAVLFATGNSGPAAGSVSPPAARDDPGLRSFGVGATSGVDPMIEAASYSGRGPSPCAGGIKPEVSAPGTVPEVRANTSGSARLSGFAVQGTSFAVAQASATIALLRQLRPNGTPASLKQVLIDSARDLGPSGPDNDTGYGLVDVPAATARLGAQLAGSLLQLDEARNDGERVTLRVRNRGRNPWPGGTLLLEASDLPAVEGALPLIAAGGSLVVELPAASFEDATRVRATILSNDLSPVLSRWILFEPPNLFGGFVLETGALRAGANDFGRIGRIAAIPGFEWRGMELLTAGGLGVTAEGRVSDGFYVTTIGRSDQKDRPPAVDTDWAPQRPLTEVETNRAEFRFDDFDGLSPLQLEVRSELEATESGGVAALTITSWISNRSNSDLSDLVPALLADWDLAGGENLRWSSRLQALVTESREGGGPLAILAADGVTLARADVPLGTPSTSGFYAEESGVLWDEFRDETKLMLMQGGSDDGLPGASFATDRAALLGLEPLTLPSGEVIPVRFWLLAADDENAAEARLAELRADPIEPPPGGGENFQVDPPYPNPLRVGEGTMRFPVQVPAEATQRAATLTLEVFDVAGRRLYRQRENLGSSGSMPVLGWDGRLDGGAPAAAGVYMYVVTLDGDRRTGRLMLVR
ncbi:MAG: S8 family serine peptidase [marine benthic group bacterium]|nr:S8 family serine peptidase [Gemmatimonadota bacterium]